MGRPKIKVIGVGGGGSNAINRMIELGLGEISFLKKTKDKDTILTGQEIKTDVSACLSYYATNTDLMALEKSLAPFKIQLGPTLTRGLGAGGKPEVGEKAAEESEEALKIAFEDTDLLIIAAGMGGGTGTGAAPVLAKIAKNMGILTIGFVTKPFEFEGKPRKNNSEEGIRKLRENVDALITINNQRLLLSKNKDYEIDQAFLMADDVLRQGIQGICEIVYEYDVVNADFKDLEAILKDSGDAYLGIGIGKGQKRAVEAAQEALNSEILEYGLKGAKNLLVNVRGGKNFKISEAEEATNTIKRMVHPECNIIWGAGIHDKLGEELQITVIASGFIRNPEMINQTTNSEDEKKRNDILTIPDIMSGIEHPEPFFTKNYDNK